MSSLLVSGLVVISPVNAPVVASAVERNSSKVVISPLVTLDDVASANGEVVISDVVTATLVISAVVKSPLVKGADVSSPLVICSLVT